MRVISGHFKGKKILEPKDKNTRPLKDLVKESIFNIIHHSKKFNINIEGSNILDLFSGVGSFGIEALSRGAQHVKFVENYNDVLPILKKNIEKINQEEKSEIIEKNILNEIDFKKICQKFDIIFLDPPFKEKNMEILINKIYKSKILKETGIMIIHRHSQENEILIPEFQLYILKSCPISLMIYRFIVDNYEPI